MMMSFTGLFNFIMFCSDSEFHILLQKTTSIYYCDEGNDTFLFPSKLIFKSVFIPVLKRQILILYHKTTSIYQLLL